MCLYPLANIHPISAKNLSEWFECCCLLVFLYVTTHKVFKKRLELARNVKKEACSSKIFRSLFPETVWLFWCSDQLIIVLVKLIIA